MLNKYISKYINGFSFKHLEHISQEICDIQVEIDVSDYKDAFNHREKAQVILLKDNLKYVCECVDIHNWENNFFCITLNGRTFICFRKTLYGFTLLDANTLLEEYDYFPAKVLDGEESFIIVDAKSFGNLIIFDGCYWACLYAYFAYDYEQKRFLNLSDEFGLNSENNFVIEKNTLILTGSSEKEEEIKIIVTQDEIYRLLNEKGVFDL